MTSAPNHESIFQHIRLSRAAGGADTACSRLPDAPGLYAWFRSLTISPAGTPETFAESVLTAVEGKAAPDQRARFGELHAGTLEASSSLGTARTAQLRQLSQVREFRDHLSGLLETASLLQAPLYIGKAQSIQRRIRQHLDPMSDLATRLREAQIDIRTCIVVYRVVDELISESDAMLRLVEDILTRVCRPGFVLRSG